MKVVWRPAALADLSRLISHIAMDNPSAAARMSRLLRQAAENLPIFPYRGRVGAIPDTRELVTVQPYIIVYKVVPDENSLDVLRIWHAAQSRQEEE
jgi:toxin ParE1/3/4